MATVPYPPWIADGPVSIICENCKSAFPWHTDDCMYSTYKPNGLPGEALRTVFVSKDIYDQLLFLAQATRESVDSIATIAIKKYMEMS